MKLYFIRGSGSLAAHIALHESGLPFEAIAVSAGTRLLPDGTSYLAINPLGYVPVLEMAGGQRLREGAAILQYVADQAPALTLAPAPGTLGRYRLQEWLHFIGTELHKGLSPLVQPAAPESLRAQARAHVARRLAWVDAGLAGQPWLLGQGYSVADAHLFAVVHAAHRLQVGIADLAHLTAWNARMRARPAVQAALEAEGLA